MKTKVTLKRNFKIINFFVLASMIYFTLLTLNCFPQNNYVCHKDHNKNTSDKKDSTVKIIDALKRDDNAGEAIIIQRHRDDSSADKWVHEYIEKTRNKLNTLKQTKSSGCSNLDFENGNFSSWTGQTATNYGYAAGNGSPSPESTWAGTAPVATRHTIVSGGTDPYGGFPMLAPNGGAFSVKLGNDNTNWEAEQLIYSFVVQPQDTNFIYKYAVVLQDPGTSHTVSEKPYFEMKIYDGASTIIPCSYQQYIANGTIPGFQNNGDIRYKPWTTVGINLGTYVGQTITVVVTSADCAQGAHFGYGYIDFICPSSFSLTPNLYCDNVTSASLTVPDVDPGMAYNWSTGATTPSITINPQLYDGSSVNCYIESPTSVGLCGFWYAFPIQIVAVEPEFNFTTSCQTITFTDASTINTGSIQSWLWDFGDGNTSSTQNPSHTYSSSGTYNVTLTVTTAICGQESVTHPVTTDPALPAIVSNNSPICAGQNLNLTSLPPGASGYSWTGPNLFTSATQNPTITSATTLATGTYIVTITMANGCTSTGQTIVTINAIPSMTAPPNITVCNGATVPASLFTSIPAGATFAWTNSNASIGLAANGAGNTPSFTATNTGASAITATISVTPSINTCTGSTVNYTITVNPTATATVSSNSPICEGQNLNLNATPTGGTNYSWNGPNLFTSAIQNPTITNVTTLAAGTYNVTVTTVGGCTSIGQTTVTVNPNPTVTQPTNITVCNGATVPASAFISTPSGATFAWTNSNTVIGLSGSGSGNVPSFTATNTGTTAILSTISVIPTLNGCVGTAIIYTITVNPTPSVTNSPLSQIICSGANTSLVTLTSNVFGATFAWTATATSGTTGFTASGTGDLPVQTISNSGTIVSTVTYVITPTANGCPGPVTNYTITVNPIPTSTFTATPIACTGNLSTINYTGTGNSLSTFIWTWDGGAAFPGNGIGPHSVSWSNSGTKTITLTVSDNGCPSALTTVSVTNPTPLVSSITPTDILCNGQLNGAVDLTVSGGTPSYHFAWSGPDTTEDLSGVGAGIYSVLVTDANGCTTTNGTTILEPSPFHVSTNPGMFICSGQTAYLTVSVTGGTGPNYYYIWSNGFTTSSIAVTPLTYTTYTVSATDQNGCTASASVTIYVSPPIIVSLIPNTDSVCPGDPVMLTPVITGGVGPPYMLIDQNGMVVTPPIYVYPNTSGYYSVYVEDACGTHDTGLVYIHVMPFPPAAAFADSLAGCQPFTVHFNEVNPDSGRIFVWDFGDNENLSLAQNPVHTFTQPGVFTVTLTVTSQWGCKTIVQYTDMITVWPKPNAQFTWIPEFASIIKPIVTFNNMTTGGSSYIWTFGDGDSSSIIHPVHRFPDAGSWDVQLIAISNMGCRDTVMYPIVIQDEWTFYSPTAFSPDFDGMNDFFYVIAHGIKETGFYLAVYDRWGEVIWETTNYSELTEKSEKWDGRAKNHNLVQIGTYTWYAKFIDFKGNDHEKAGAITVIR